MRKDIKSLKDRRLSRAHGFGLREKLFHFFKEGRGLRRLVGLIAQDSYTERWFDFLVSDPELPLLSLFPKPTPQIHCSFFGGSGEKNQKFVILNPPEDI